MYFGLVFETFFKYHVFAAICVVVHYVPILNVFE